MKTRYPYPHHVESFFPAYTLNGMGAFGVDPVTAAVQQAAAKAGKAAVDAAWPELQRRFYAELPRAVDTALDEAQPRIRTELDRASDIATSRAVMVGVGLAIVVVATGWWVRKGR